MSRRSYDRSITSNALRRPRGRKPGGRSLRRRLSLERLEDRHLLAGDLLFGSVLDSSGLPDDASETQPVVGITPDFGTAPDLPTDEFGMAEAAALPLDQTFLLHSRPGATKVIYLDFDGHTTSGTSWNTSKTGGADFTTPAYSFQGDTSSFTNTELQRIQNIWERVAEDFIPFDVDVTTQDPGVEALRKSGSGDTQWGIRVVIGGGWADWYGSSAGGVAYIGSFDWNSDTPCYAFENNLSGGAEKTTAEAISHEAGHTLELSHDGTSSESYYRGHGSGATGWAPIMGVGYDREFVQWSKGEYPDANQTQDDLSRITTLNGFGYRPDDHGSTRAHGHTAHYHVHRRLQRRTHRAQHGRGLLLILDDRRNDQPRYRPVLSQPEPRHSGDALQLLGNHPRDEQSRVGVDANLSMTLGPGTYYVSVDGTGKPANGSDFGYSDYGSLGRYTIAGTVVDTATPGIELYGKSFAVAPISLYFANGFVDASFSIENNGSVTAPAFDTKFYLSDDATIDPASDLLLSLDPGSGLFDPSEPAAYHVPAGLATFGVHSATVRLAVPIDDPIATDNQYYVGMQVDADGDAAEPDETNNGNRGAGVDLQWVTYAPAYFNSASISIPTSGTANPYPSNIVISGIVGAVVDVNVSLFGLTHTNPDDLDILLVGPAGQKVLLLSDVGGTPDIAGVSLVLDDAASSSLPDSTQLIAGTYKPTNIGSGDTFTSPAPAGPYASLLSAFQLTNPNGTWSLYVQDDATSNSGTIAGGWGLTFAFGNAPPTNPANVPLAAIDEDPPAAIDGYTVAAIVAASGSVDSEGNPMGIAVSSVDNSHGQWQFSNDGGDNWQDILLVSAASRLLAPADRIRFVPVADFNSSVAASPPLGFKMWDQTSGSPGDVADTTTSSAFSALVASATQPVTPVNDAPSFALIQSVVLADEDAGTFVLDGFAVDLAAGPAMATDEAAQGVEFVATIMATTGNLSFEVAPSIDPTTGKLSFTTALNTNGTATIDVLVRDSGNGTSPNVNESATQTFAIEVAPVNDGPVIAVNAELVAERGTATVVTNLALAFTDAENGPAELTYAVLIGPSHGSILVNGAPATHFTQAQIDAGVVSYQNDGTTSWTDKFDFEVNDGAGGVNDGTFNILIRPHPGDFNRDLVVDAADYSLWRRNVGTAGVSPYSGADGNGDGQIGPEDYDVWRAHFGESISASGAGSGATFASRAAGSASDEESRAAVGQTVTDNGAVAGRQAQPDVPSSDAVFKANQPQEFGVLGTVVPVGSSASSGTRAVRRHTSLEDGSHQDDALIAWLASHANDQHQLDESANPADASEPGDDSPDSLCEELDALFAILATSD